MKNNQVAYSNVDIIDIFAKIDKNGDKNISLEEFQEGITKYFKETYD